MIIDLYIGAFIAAIIGAASIILVNRYFQRDWVFFVTTIIITIVDLEILREIVYHFFPK